MDVSACQPGADIPNHLGYLQCPACAGTWGKLGAAPAGSYQQSCNGWRVIVAGGGGHYIYQLSASCRTIQANANNDSYVTATLLINLSQCAMGADIQNLRGTLLCQPLAPGQQPVVPQGNPKQVAAAQAASAPAKGTCKPGYVWREANPEDHVCVTPQQRQQVVNDNAAASQHTESGGRVKIPGTPPAACLQGYVWRQERSPNLLATIRAFEGEAPLHHPSRAALGNINR